MRGRASSAFRAFGGLTLVWKKKKERREKTRYTSSQAGTVHSFYCSEIRVKIAAGGQNREHEYRRVLSRYRGEGRGLSFDLIAFRGNDERKADTSGPR